MGDGGAARLEDRDPRRIGPAAGFSLLHMTNIRKAGAYDMNLAVIVLPRPYQPGDEGPPLQMLKQPLEVRVESVE